MSAKISLIVAILFVAIWTLVVISNSGVNRRTYESIQEGMSKEIVFEMFMDEGEQPSLGWGDAYRWKSRFGGELVVVFIDDKVGQKSYEEKDDYGNIDLYEEYDAMKIAKKKQLEYFCDNYKNLRWTGQIDYRCDDYYREQNRKVVKNN